MPTTRLVNWNLQWATPTSSRHRAIRQVLTDAEPDICVLTETGRGDFFSGGHLIASHHDYGYASAPATRRKVRMWSRTAWDDVDDRGNPWFPGGRFVAGTTKTPNGPLRVIGVCIPWKDAHVRTGRRDRSPWEDHRAFLQALDAYLREQPADFPTVIAGDFNQTIPRTRAPEEIAASLERILAGWHVVTSGARSAAGKSLIDHVAVQPIGESIELRVIERTLENNVRLSDHDGVIVDIAFA